MAATLRLAARGLGRVWPNPAVGCILVRNGYVVGRGWTQPGGRPHAETEALRQAGQAARGATAYVSLEPCDHVGRTPPCSLALIDAGVVRVVAAHSDPDPRVAGAGFRRLRAAGVDVCVGVGAAWGEALNRGFIYRVTKQRPSFTAKIASSLDGRVATKSGESQWLTGVGARADGHLLRASHDAILVGRGTVESDNPALTCRLAGVEGASPVRVILDSQLCLPAQQQVFQTAGRVPTWLVTTAELGVGSDRTLRERAARLRLLQDLGVDILSVGCDSAGRIDLAAMARQLACRGITRVLVEGGSTVLTAMLRADLIDRLVWYRSGQVVGGDGLAAMGPLQHEVLTACPLFARTGMRRIGDDVREDFERSTGPA